MPRTIERLGRRLGLDAAVVHLYVEIERQAARAATAPPTESEQLTRDAVAVLAEPHHLALLELTTLADFRADSRWAARVLGVDVDRVNVALSRLARLGLLRMEKHRWVSCAGDATVSARVFHEATLRLLFERLAGATPKPPTTGAPRRARE